MPYSAKVVQLTFNLPAHILISMKKGQIPAFLTVTVFISLMKTKSDIHKQQQHTDYKLKDISTVPVYLLYKWYSK